MQNIQCTYILCTIFHYLCSIYYETILTTYILSTISYLYKFYKDWRCCKSPASPVGMSPVGLSSDELKVLLAMFPICTTIAVGRDEARTRDTPRNESRPRSAFIRACLRLCATVGMRWAWAGGRVGARPRENGGVDGRL